MRRIPLLITAVFFVTSVFADSERPPRPLFDSFFSAHTRTLRKFPSRGAGGFSAEQFAANEFCRDAYVAELTIQEGIQSIPVNADYCELPSESLPSQVILLLGNLRKIHERYAEVVGIDPARLYGFGVSLRIAEDAAGPFTSRTLYDIEIDVFSDFKADAFPEKIYSHELTHLIAQQGGFGEGIQTIEPSYFFREGFPDLVASYVSRSAKIDFKDDSIRPELMSSLVRDGTPLKTMKLPFRYFYLGTFQSSVLNVCKSIPEKSRSANEKSLCELYTSEREREARRGGIYAGAMTLSPGNSTLELPFNPKNCLIRYKDGSVSLDGCAIYSFSTVLISFFHSIGSELGDRPIALMIEALKKAARMPGNLTCHFTDEETKSFTMAIPSFVDALDNLRSSLSESGRKHFDVEWAKHGLDSWRRIEAYDRRYGDETFVYQELLEKNPDFAKKNRCLAKKGVKRKPECQPLCSFVPAIKN